MPCYDPRDSSPAAIRSEARGEFAKEFTHNSPVAELLCWTLTHMVEETRAKFLAANPQLAYWWDQHQARDAAKEQSNVRT